MTKRSFEPLITITEINRAEMNLKAKTSAKKKELDPTYVPDKTEPNEASIAKKKQTTGYINPFNYEKLTTRKSRRRSKHLGRTYLKWACMICNEVTPDKESLIDHYEVHKKERDEKMKSEMHDEKNYFNCAICGQEFMSLKSYDNHFEKKHGDRNHSCLYCEKVYKDAFQLCIHNQTVHPTEDKKYRCTTCDYATLTRKKIKQHLQEHENSCEFKCEACGKGFQEESWFEEHNCAHVMPSPFSCDVCGETFSYTKYLLVHKKNAHPEIFGDNPTANECQLCHKRFAHKKSLILHIRGHTGENSVLCDMCGKRLSNTEQLKQHLRIHTGSKPYKCSVCDKGFAKKCNLTLHERVHSGEKPYVCKVCAKAFSQRSTLVIHERYHSGERPYVCHLCNKGFVARGLLSVHVKNCAVIPDEYL